MNMNQIRSEAWKQVKDAESRAKALRAAAEALDAAMNVAPAKVAALATEKKSEGPYAKLSREELERRLRRMETDKKLLRRQLNDPAYRQRMLDSAARARAAKVAKARPTVTHETP